MVSALDIRFRALAGDIVLCFSARHLTLTVPLSTQVYNIIVASCYRNRDKLRPDGSLGPNADFTYHPKRQVRILFFKFTDMFRPAIQTFSLKKVLIIESNAIKLENV